jgi:hypothetical protein
MYISNKKEQYKKENTKKTAKAAQRAVALIAHRFYP